MHAIARRGKGNVNSLGNLVDGCGLPEGLEGQGSSATGNVFGSCFSNGHSTWSRRRIFGKGNTRIFSDRHTLPNFLDRALCKESAATGGLGHKSDRPYLSNRLSYMEGELEM